MIKELYKSICDGTEVRKNLISLRQEMKEPFAKRALAYELAGEFDVFVTLLKNEDAKVRKNAALIIGDLECQDLLPVLIKAYKKEEKLFIKADLLKAISQYEYQEYLPMLKERLSELTNDPVEESNVKHVREEAALLQNMILKYEKPQKHKFTGVDKALEVILLTNRNHREVTKNQIKGGEIKMLAGGLRVATECLTDILPIRTYQEMLFPVKGAPVLKGTPEEMAYQLKRSGLLPFLEEMHSEEGSFYFRVELKSRMTLDKKGTFIRKFSASLEKQLDRKMINSSSEYEIELRLIENKAGDFIPLLKLYTLEDKRFAYRKQALPTSISPCNAALIMELSKEYLRDGAQVLDPFCGVGTMLIERSKISKADPIYGLDILEEAVVKAEENTKNAGMIAHYINRDYFDFRHEYLFDEIVTNMPGVSKTKDRVFVQKLYEKFWSKSTEVLKEDGCIVMYSDEREVLLGTLRRQNYFKLVKETVINDREGSSVFIVKCR